MNVPKVADVMDSQTHAVRSDLDVDTAVQKLIDAGVTGAPVVDANGDLVGLITERECLQLVTHREDAPPRVEQVMQTDFLKATPDMDVAYVAGMFNAHPEHRRCVVCEDGKLVGVLTRKDILRVIQSLATS